MSCKSNKISKNDEEWRKVLSDEAFKVTRERATEAPFSGEYNSNYAIGMYLCACCNKELFDSSTKFDSGSGWPSFYAPASDDSIEEHQDMSYGMIRTEVTCSSCDAHLGHVFFDWSTFYYFKFCNQFCKCFHQLSSGLITTLSCGFLVNVFFPETGSGSSPCFASVQRFTERSLERVFIYAFICKAKS